MFVLGYSTYFFDLAGLDTSHSFDMGVGVTAKDSCASNGCQVVFGIVMNVVVPYMVNPDEGNMKGKVGAVFGGCAAVATIASWVYIHELKGHTFEGIDLTFPRRVPPRRMGAYVVV
ncbi:hypothetical protein BDW59DRAFT_163816 [Aspergillus cavernicola]|uniref:Uncharacterized protein n=1 Tax=Aspergillus cavernicola TaxID=176166 RepID=A0ABR4I5U3_9EURO